ncbi:MAG: serine/threonine protein kinase [Pirellulales bacterium]|nr:serine/threonine protein kinase [Pirellulales bacterium]
MERAAEDSRSLPDETIDLLVESSSSLTDIERPRVELVAGSGPELATEVVGLLRARLRVAAIVFLAPMVYFTLRRWLGWSAGEGGYNDILIAYRYFVLLVFVLVTAALWSPISLSLSELRAIELALFGLPCVLMVFLHHALLQEAAAKFQIGPPELTAAREDHVRLVLRTLALMWFAVVLIYGTFIPTSLRRGAAVMGAMALAPLAVVAWALVEFPTLRHSVFPDEFLTMVATMAVGYATALYGSYKIGILRREAFEARQLGQYRLTERIGAGGMGEVFLAEHQMLKRPCAIKLIRPGQAADTRSLARFEREVRAIARLSHWNSVEIFDYGRADDGTFYYAMEYLPGLSLQEVVERQGPLQPERAVHLLRQVCGALIEAHAAGIVHRDIKPSNIIASQRGGVYDVAKLVDFGLATSAEESREIKLTQEGAIAGSPLYMAPERFLEDGEPSPSSDIYSLGAVAYYLITGQPPFRGETPVKVMIAHARELAVPPRQLNPNLEEALERIVLRCLAKEPDQRFADVRELESALGACRCANRWSQELAARWWTTRPESPTLDTSDRLAEATIA